jgi:hypothetical protein
MQSMPKPAQQPQARQISMTVSRPAALSSTTTPLIAAQQAVQSE